MAVRTTAAVALVAALLLPGAGTAQELPGRMSTVLLMGALTPKKAVFATGVILTAGKSLTIVTAAHITPYVPLTIFTMRGEILQAHSVRTVPNHDMALIESSPVALSYPVPPTAAVAPATGGRLYVWGFDAEPAPIELDASMLFPAIDMPEQNGSPRIGIACSKCGHGDSGAGVFAQDGSLIGIVTSGWYDHNGAQVFVEAEPIGVLDTLRTVACGSTGDR
ncbi:MAG: trypsin-like peptidase domain-containing protein [Candidatus Eremiobacteraeota bacterium]|nr:trypsin-like peptidase domain-containing protein [Candidatus Eremiobacteraeota bacterium]